jgi:hypothetical protein
MESFDGLPTNMKIVQYSFGNNVLLVVHWLESLYAKIITGGVLSRKLRSLKDRVYLCLDLWISKHQSGGKFSM